MQIAIRTLKNPHGSIYTDDCAFELFLFSSIKPRNDFRLFSDWHDLYKFCSFEQFMFNTCRNYINLGRVSSHFLAWLTKIWIILVLNHLHKKDTLQNTYSERSLIGSVLYSFVRNDDSLVRQLSTCPYVMSNDHSNYYKQEKKMMLLLLL